MTPPLSLPTPPPARLLAAAALLLGCTLAGSGCAMMDAIGASDEDFRWLCCCWPFEPGATFIREPHPRKFADFDSRYSTDFREGDRFELLRDMYLFDSEVKGEWFLEEDSWNQWGRPLLRVVPVGETVRISHLKLSPHQKTLFVFVELDSGEDWVFVPLFYGLEHRYYQDRFRKLPPPPAGAPDSDEPAPAPPSELSLPFSIPLEQPPSRPQITTKSLVPLLQN